jgi:tRNA(Ile)-lysidine synthase
MTSRPHTGPQEPLLKQTAETMACFNMAAAGDRVLIAVSGGPDSIALFHILRQLAAGLGIQLAVAHLNHGLRPGAADREAAFVNQLARDHGIPFHLEHIHLDKQRGSLEERARKARYAFLHRAAAAHGYTRIALGHQVDDNVEAMLMHLLRGSGIRGLAGIPPTRDGIIIRPLIRARRHQIVSFLKEHHYQWMEDASNRETRFVRNRIRHELLPYLRKAFNANIVETLNRTAALCREEEAWFQSYLTPLVTAACSLDDTGGLRLNRQIIIDAAPPIQRRIIREALRQWMGDLRRFGAVHIDALVDLLPGHQIGRRVSLPNGVTATRTGDSLCFEKTTRRSQSIAASSTGFEYCVPAEFNSPLTINIPECRHTLIFTRRTLPQPSQLSLANQRCAWFDMHALTFPLTVRNFRPGDRLTPFGMSGSQKVKKLLIDRKIPQHERMRIPLLLDAEQMLWVVGVRRAARAAITSRTTEVLCVEAL